MNAHQHEDLLIGPCSPPHLGSPLRLMDQPSSRDPRARHTADPSAAEDHPNRSPGNGSGYSHQPSWSLIERMKNANRIDFSQVNALLFNEVRSSMKYILAALRMCGLNNIACAGQLTEAVQHIISQTFDLIFLTHIGEAAQAGQLLEELKGIEATAEIPIIAITDDQDIKTMLRIASKGVDKVLVLPLSKQAVEDQVEDTLTRHRAFAPQRRDLIQAGQYAANGQFDQAQQIYLQLLAGEPGSIEIYLALHQVKCAQRCYDEAAGYLEKAFEAAKLLPDRVEQHQQLAAVLNQYGNYFLLRKHLDKAAKHYRAAIRLNPFHIESVKALLELAQKQDSFKDVLEVIAQAEQAFSPYSQAATEIADCIEKVGRRFMELDMPEEGERVYERLLHWPHEDTAIHLKVADYFLERGQISQVLRQLIALSARVKDADVLERIGSILLRVEKSYMEGGRLVAEASPDLEFFQKMTVQDVLGLAFKTFRQALLLEPDHLTCRFNLVRCHLRVGEPNQATDMISHVKELHGSDESIIATMIAALIEEEAYLNAHKECAEAIKRFAGSIRFHQLDARAHRDAGNHYEAIACLKKALAVRHDEPELMLDLAETYQEIGQFSEALNFLERASRFLPNDPRIEKGLAQVLQAKHQPTS